jgi:small subunit ribosomal protein S3
LEKRCVRLAVEKKFVQDGFKKAMIDEFFLEKLERAGYGGMDINRTPMGTQITIRAEKPGMIIGKSGKMIRKFTKDLDVRFKLDNPQIDVQEVKRPELNAQMMATRLANALERGWYFRKAGQSTLQRIMDSGAMGVEIVIAGKLTGPRKRTEKFIAGYIKHCGKPVEEFVDVGYARAKKKLGIIGVKVRIMPPGSVLPDHIEVLAPPKEEAAKPVAPEVKPAEGAAAEVEKIIAESAKAEASEKAPGQKPEEKRRKPRQRRRAPPKPAMPAAKPAAEEKAGAPPAEAPAVVPVEAPAEPAAPPEEKKEGV